ncbi:MAG: glycosyltransferase family 4 protein [Bacteroidales bacterium]
MNILFAIDSFFDGGAEIFAIRLANEMSKYNNVYFIELETFYSEKKEQLSLLNKTIRLFQPDYNYKLHVFRFLQKKRFFKILFYKMRIESKDIKKRIIINYLKKNKIDIVHSHSWNPDMYFAGIKKTYNFKLLSSLHGHYEIEPYKSPPFSDITRKLINKIDHVIYLTNDHLKTFSAFNYPTLKMSKIFYGFDKAPTSQITNWNKEKPLRLILISRAIPEKGWEQAIEAVCEMQSEGKNIMLDLLGDGPVLNELKLKYEKLSFIHFRGFQINIDQFLEMAHLSLLPTYYYAESLPNSIIEYLSHGKPVIATDIAAIREMIDTNGNQAGILFDGKRGEIVDKNNIKEAIYIYYTHPEKITIDSQHAIEAYKKFEMRKCVENYQIIYNNLLE